MTRREQLQKQARTAFIASITSSINLVNQAIRTQAGVVQLGDVRGVADMQAKQEQLLKSDQALENARVFFGNPTEDYRRAMVGAGLDALYIEAELRSPAIVEAVMAPQALVVIQKAENLNHAAARLVQVMSEALGTWSYDRLTQRFQFDSSASAANYREAAQQLEQNSAELEAALADWTRQSKLKG